MKSTIIFKMQYLSLEVSKCFHLLETVVAFLLNRQYSSIHI